MVTVPRKRKNVNKDEKPAEPVQDNPDVSQESPPVEATAEASAQKAPEHHDETDVEAALQRSTKDGKGEGEVPPPDFDSFATAGVEKGENKTVEVLANEVLQGRWGDGRLVRQRLRDAGHDASAVQTEVNRRLSDGAPSAYTVDTREVAAQVIRGEWGDESVQQSNLERAGYNWREVNAEVYKQLGGGQSKSVDEQEQQEQ